MSTSDSSNPWFCLKAHATYEQACLQKFFIKIDILTTTTKIITVTLPALGVRGKRQMRNNYAIITSQFHKVRCCQELNIVQLIHILTQRRRFPA